MEASSLFYKTTPSDVHNSGSVPALIFLHGRGTDEDDLLGLSEYIDPRLFIASVRAPYKFPSGGYTWFHLDETGKIDIDQLVSSSDCFLHWLDDFQQHFSIDPHRIFLFGFSMGAMMSLTLALSSPHRFKGVIAHSGFLPEHERLSYRWSDLRSLSFYLAHGIYDPIVSIELGRQTYHKLLQADANVLLKEHSIPHTIDENSMTNIAHWIQEQLL